jgi:hypothetical protein
VTHVSSYTANLAQKFLRAALLMAAEYFQLRVPSMTSRYGRGRAKPVKAILAPEQVGVVLKARAAVGRAAVLTLAGRSCAARIAGSLLHAIGLPELVTCSPEAYEALAREPAREAGRQN